MKIRPLLLVAALLLLSFVPAAIAFTQDTGPTGQFEITGVNPTELPLVRVTASVRDPFGQPITGLTKADFTLVGELAERAEIVSVTSVVDADLPISYVLVIDTSTSMDGAPIASAKEAARAFVESLGPGDPVALMTFASSVRLVLDFTTDRAAILSALDALTVGGQTYLYEGALAGVEKAAGAAAPRRLLVLLSDGGQYDTRHPQPTAPREAAAEAAARLGVPVYTVGLGFGTDRTFLQALADSTNARFVESPTPEELRAAFDSLAQSFRSQYEILIRADLPADGTTYTLGLQADTPFGALTDEASLRTPVPVPVVRAPVLLDEPISQPTEITVEVIADDGVAAVEVLLDGAPVDTLTAAPFTYTIDPLTMAPGPHTLAFVATDNDGDTGTATVAFEAAALPPEISFVADLPQGELRQITIVEVAVGGQTAPAGVTFRLDGQEGVTVAEPPFVYGIDPSSIAPGPHTLTITAENQGGVQAEIVREFTVADMPPAVAISGLTAGQTLEDTATVSVDVLTSQAPQTAIAFAVNGQPAGDDSGTLTLRAADLPPGPATLQVTVTNDLGQITTVNVPFTVAALPPVVTVDGLAAGDEVAEDRAVTVEAGGQTAITGVTVTLDGAPLAVSDGVYPLRVLALEPGAHTLNIDVLNAGGQRRALELAFEVSAGPSLTATALVTPSDTPTPEPSPTPTARATNTPDASASATAVQATANAQATAVSAEASATAFSAAATGTADAVAAQAEADASATVSVEQQATISAQATSDAHTRALMQATVNAQATSDLRATINAQLTEAASTEAPATATTAAQVVPAATITSTPTTDLAATAAVEQAAQATLDAQATQNAQATLDTQATQNAQATLDTQAALDTQATQNAQATLDTQAALDIQATRSVQATQNARATTSAAQATVNAQATIEARATLDMQATDRAQATLDAAGTLEATATAPAETTPTVEPTTAAQVEDASATPTVTGRDRTPSPTMTPIGTLIPAQAETTPESSADLLPLLLIGLGLLVLLIVIFLVLSRARRQR